MLIKTKKTYTICVKGNRLMGEYANTTCKYTTWKIKLNNQNDCVSCEYQDCYNDSDEIPFEIKRDTTELNDLPKTVFYGKL